jgi:purine-binding chemotaxis protein CheW
VADIKSPEDSLNHYFDDLLGAEMPLQETPVRKMPPATSKSVALVSASVKSETYGENNNAKPYGAMGQSPNDLESQPLLNLNSNIKRNLAPAAEQKLQLEQLFHKARTQLLTGLHPLEKPIKPQGHFVNDPHEIQEWVVAEELPLRTHQAPFNAIEPLILAPEEKLLQAEVNRSLAAVAWLENGRPIWAQAGFDVLLFKVSGLTLAVPLICLGKIRPITGELTPLFGQADWFMGFQLTSAGKISTVNTAKFVMPERYDERFLKTAKYVVSIDGVPWGLAVDSINQPISLVPEDVKWRTDRSKRPWLAGTVKEHMCALLDIPQIAQLLIAADKNYTPINS